MSCQSNDICKIFSVNTHTHTHIYTYTHTHTSCKFVYMLSTTNMGGVTTFKVNLKMCELIVRH